MFKSIKENATAEVVEKKSKFIANVFYVESREEAEEIIKKINKQYHDARHNCYAYRVITSEGIIEKASDDGEPSGTAGAPMLTILSKNNLANVLVIVTRYFGGILLGTGGLVRAYAKGAKIGIDKAGIAEFVQHVTFDVAVSYGDYDKVMKDLEKNKVLCRNTEFSDVVKLSLSCEEQNLPAFENYIADLTNGKVKCEMTGNVYAPKTE